MKGLFRMAFFNKSSFTLVHLFLATFFISTIHGITIIVDTDLFIEEIRSRTAWDIGAFNLIRGFSNPMKIINNYFDALNKITPSNPNSPLIVKFGVTLPQHIKNWLSNSISADQARTFAHSELKKLEKSTGHSTKLYRAIADHTFTPERYAKVRDCNKEGYKLLKMIYDQRDAQGNRKHKICGFTNQNAESFNALCKNKEIKAALDLLDDILTSGDAHMLKPDPAFFELAFKRFGIKEDELFIYLDIEITFIIVANSLGKKNLHCIHCKDYNFKPVLQEFKRLGIVPPHASL